MKKAILLVVMVTLAAFVSGAIAAAPPKAASTAPAPAAPASTAPVKLDKFSGAIKSADAMSIVVAKGKTEKTFGVTADTKITKGKEALKVEDLKAGMQVTVESKKEMDKMIAVTIKVSAPKAAPKK
ncbi:MAG TPA: hypothetical protein VLZ03_14815 [Thermodesulfobacteriota bacterium]|nr:hypothetical protein [Thermodesulfobacteriota bacterium]